MKDSYDFIRRGGVCPSEEQRLQTREFYRNAVEIYARFDNWKDYDRFYFLPLYLEMTYTVGGIVAEVAPDPVWLGSFVSAVRLHPELLQYPCPKCGKTVFPYRFVGSPLSGRVDLEGRCSCGWKGFEMVSGWRERAAVLREQIERDAPRYRKYRLLHPGSSPASVSDLLRLLGEGHV